MIRIESDAVGTCLNQTRSFNQFATLCSQFVPIFCCIFCTFYLYSLCSQFVSFFCIFVYICCRNLPHSAHNLYNFFVFLCILICICCRNLSISVCHTMLTICIILFVCLFVLISLIHSVEK